MKLKLFVWHDFSPDYTPGLAFAIAKNEAEAKNIIEKERGYEITYWGNLVVYDIQSIGFSVSGGG